MKVKRNVYDSLFTHLLSDKKYALKAYQAIEPDDHSITEDDIEDITIHNVFVNEIYNDFSMVVKNEQLFFIEAQSYSLNNICYRIGTYYFEVCKKRIENTNRWIYSSKPLPLPVPRFYVVYSGSEKVPDYISFKDIYFPGLPCDLDITVHIIKEKSEIKSIFDEYLFFCKRFKANRKLYGNTTKAIEVTLDECIQANVLVDYIDIYREEIISMMDFLYNQEKQLKSLLKETQDESFLHGIELGKEQGIELGKEQERINRNREIAKKMKNKGMSIEDIMELTDLSKDEIEQL